MGANTSRLVRCAGVVVAACALGSLATLPARAGGRPDRLTAWPSVLPASGGRVHLLAQVAPGAQACLFSSPLGQLVREFVANEGRAGGSATATATLPPNFATAARRFRFRLDVYLGSARGSVIRYVSVVQRGRPAAPTQLSSNWAGYVATNQTFGAVEGDFNVPAVRCAPGISTVGSQWVGIDGARSATVEQDGVDMDCVNGSPQYYAWYEMFGDPAVNGGYSVNLPPSSYPVSPGDSISAGVSSPSPNDPLDPHRYTWYLSTNNTAGWSFDVTLPAPDPAPPQSSAEWIVERPGSQLSSLLSDFGTAAFTRANADNLDFSVGGPISLFPHQSLRMHPSGPVLAMTGPLTSTRTESSFSVTWRTSG